MNLFQHYFKIFFFFLELLKGQVVSLGRPTWFSWPAAIPIARLSRFRPLFGFWAGGNGRESENHPFLWASFLHAGISAAG